MLANMACSLIEHKRINTTVAKAKALKQFIEPLITKSKAENNLTAEKGTHNRRIVFKNLRDKYAVTELFSEVSEKVADRPGGYTRIIKLGNRLGDNADMAMIELVDFNELYNAGKPKKKTTRRSRRGSGGKGEPAIEAAQETKSEAAVKPEAEAKPAKEAKPEAKAKPEAVAEVEAPNETAPATEPETSAEPEAASETESKPKTESKDEGSEA
jgi:large subunit ribosomal protein L17